MKLDGYLAAKDHHVDRLYEPGRPEEISRDAFGSRMDAALVGQGMADCLAVQIVLVLPGPWSRCLLRKSFCAGFTWRVPNQYGQFAKMVYRQNGSVF